jgi:hypothetical protein
MNNRYILLISCILLTTISSLLFGSLAITPTEHFAKHHKKHHNKKHHNKHPPKHHKPTDSMGKLINLISPMFKFINKNIPKAEKAAKKMSLGGNMMMNPVNTAMKPVNTITAANNSSEEGGYEISPPPGTYYDAGTNSYYYYDQSATAPDQSIPLPTVPQPLSVNNATPTQLLSVNYGTPSK